jgi:hypothetical protein
MHRIVLSRPLGEISPFTALPKRLLPFDFIALGDATVFEGVAVVVDDLLVICRYRGGTKVVPSITVLVVLLLLRHGYLSCLLVVA